MPTPGSDIDTGTGGFPVGSDRYTYDVGSDVGDQQPKEKWSPGQVSVDNSVKDLSAGTKRTLASYLSDTTMGKTPSSPSPVPNKYPVESPGQSGPSDFKVTDEKGYPEPLVPPTATQPHFSDIGPGRSISSTNLNILRGRQEPSAGKTTDGNTLLKDAVDPATGNRSAVIDGFYGSTDPSLVSNSVIYNRFNPDKKYGDNSDINSPQFSKKYKSGVSAPADGEQRDQVGNVLSIRSGLEAVSTVDGINPVGNAALLTAEIPGAAQLGVTRVDQGTLTAAAVIQTLTSDGVNEGELIDPAGQSWGTLNNVNDQYSGVSAGGMQVLAVALLIALSIVVGLMTAILKFTVGSSKNYIDVDELGRRPYGASEYSADGRSTNSSSGILKSITSGGFLGLLGIPPTKYPIEKCLPAGALFFFGVDGTGDGLLGMAGDVVTKGAAAAAQSPGYYSVMARSVNRSFLLISDAFVSIGKAFASVSGIVSGFKQLIGIIDVLRESKFMRAVHIFSQFGDRILSDKSGNQSQLLDQNSIGPSKRFNSQIDLNPNGDAVSKSRLNVLPGGRRSHAPLAWAAYRAPDQLIMPINLKMAMGLDKGLGAPNAVNGISSSDPSNGKDKRKNSTYIDAAEPRISTPDREKFESSLDAEYVPFYFHDLRTNEILSFHAFLASLSDD
jgi:hypothetical protein